MLPFFSLIHDNAGQLLQRIVNMCILWSFGDLGDGNNQLLLIHFAKLKFLANVSNLNLPGLSLTAVNLLPLLGESD